MIVQELIATDVVCTRRRVVGDLTAVFKLIRARVFHQQVEATHIAATWEVRHVTCDVHPVPT